MVNFKVEKMNIKFVGGAGTLKYSSKYKYQVTWINSSSGKEDHAVFETKQQALNYVKKLKLAEIKFTQAKKKSYRSGD